EGVFWNFKITDKIMLNTCHDMYAPKRIYALNKVFSQDKSRGHASNFRLKTLVDTARHSSKNQLIFH
ncbi:hypothetical protein, partial [uncultured Turicimonas sp.]|uniref:hypothetical protein n=1 Tax=uncultured Turicimonas sp. TaxID=1918607 RepID=UPI0028060C44